MPHFGFLHAEWKDIFTAAAKAELNALPDPRTSCFYSRRALELAVAWLYTADRTLKRPYDDNLSALINEPTFQMLVGQDRYTKARIVKDLGNEAVHRHAPIPQTQSVEALRELFHICYWLGRTYARTPAACPAPDLKFDPSQLPKTSPVPPQTAAQLAKLAEEIGQRDAELKLRQQKIDQFASETQQLNEELVRLRAEIAEAKRANQAAPDTHDYSEAETRDAFIDLLLREAGWHLADTRDREFPVTGMPNQSGTGYVDYVLWGNDGRPLALVEAKRTKRSIEEGQQQAKLYADCLEKQFGQRPIIFLSNGYEHKIWDDTQYPPRPVQGFRTRDELELLTQRRTTRRALNDLDLDHQIVDRYYQERGIRKIAEAFETGNVRRALLVMATGAGKTRAVIALVDLLLRANWVRRVLFLADRVALVNQAIGAFKKHLPSCAPVNLVTEKNVEGRVYVSTYPTILSLIEELRDGERRFGPGYFDLVIIDEAHRSVYQRYGAIFEYFDSLLIGLTATPRDETDRDTYKLFQLEPGVPTDAYELQDAIADEYLVPPRSVAVPLKFQREGIAYDQLSEDEKREWDEIEWNEDPEVPKPQRVDAEAVNRWLFNEDTVDKVLETLMMHGQRVADGDRLGTTIIFAKGEDHAKYIAERFNANYPQYAGHFARVITFKTDYAQSLIDAFSKPDSMPHIAISVDMLDTGIDVPEIVNLVFFKLVRSKTKFWQMVGRGTRLCPDLFGPGVDKRFFYIFDFCGNLEFFKENPQSAESSLSMPLGKRLFVLRLELIDELDKPEPKLFPELRAATADLLRSEVAAMNANNFIVRPHRRLVERYAEPGAWESLSIDNRLELEKYVAGLPSELADTDQDAKQFDALMLRLQLAVLRAEPQFCKLRKQVEQIAGLLAEKANIPMVRAQMPLIEELQTDAFWQDVTPAILERVRKDLRALLKLIEKVARRPVFTNFEDELGTFADIELPQFTPGLDFQRFQTKARQFLREHENIRAVRKLRTLEPLTAADLQELERILVAEGIGTERDLAHARETSNGLGLFLRSLAGLDRTVAKAAFNQFLTGRTPTANQIEFLNMIIDHLAERGFLDPERLYASPFIDLSSKGVDGLFPPEQVNALFAVLQDVKASATV